MKVLVCGGRDYSNVGFFGEAMERVHRNTIITHVISGGAGGADTLAKEWAEWKGIPFTEYPANWVKHGRAAGPIRNQQMLDEGKPDLVLAFPGGRGTADVVKKAKNAGVPIEFP